MLCAVWIIESREKINSWIASALFSDCTFMTLALACILCGVIWCVIKCATRQIKIHDNLIIIKQKHIQHFHPSWRDVWPFLIDCIKWRQLNSNQTHLQQNTRFYAWVKFSEFKSNLAGKESFICGQLTSFHTD